MNSREDALREAISQLEIAVREGKLGSTADRVKALLEGGDLKKNAAEIFGSLALLVKKPEHEEFIRTLLTGGISISDLRSALAVKANHLRLESKRREYNGYVAALTDDDKKNPLKSFTSQTTGQQVGIYRVSALNVYIPWGPGMDFQGSINLGSEAGIYLDDPLLIGDTVVVGRDVEGHEIACLIDYRPGKPGNNTAIALKTTKKHFTDGASYSFHTSKEDNSSHEYPQAVNWEYASVTKKNNIDVLLNPVPLEINGVVEGFFFFIGHNEMPRFICARTGRIFTGLPDSIFFADSQKKSIQIKGVKKQEAIDSAVRSITQLYMSKGRSENFGPGGKLVRPEGFAADIIHSIFTKEKNLTLPEFLQELRRGA